VSIEKEQEVSIQTAFNSAVNLLEKGNIELAEKQLAEILGRYPEEPNALRLSGISALQQNKPEVALIPLQKAIKAAPDFAKAHQDLSNAWSQLGDLYKAEICLKRSLELDGKNFSGWKDLGDILADQGKNDESDKAYRNALESNKKYKELQDAMMLVQKGQLGEAEKIYRQLLAEDSKNVDALRLLALLASRSGALDQGITMLRKCTEIAPDYALAWENLAKLYRQKDDPKSIKMALHCFKKATELRPDWAEGWAGLGTMQTRSSQHEEGISSYKKSIELKKNQPRVHLSLGHIYKTTGESKESISSYKAAIGEDPGFGEAYWSLANLKTYQFSDLEVKEMLDQIKKKDLNERERVHFLFAMGKALEDTKDFKESFAYYHRGNELNRGRNTYDPKAIEALTSRLINFFDQELFMKAAGLGYDLKDPIFIVGLPRSGSTLVEQILSSHSCVEGTMELPNMMNIARKMGNSTKDQTAYPEVISEMPKEDLLFLGKSYIEDTKFLRSGLPYFIDKMPNNFSHVGLIKLILPNAKIIDARRNPLDTCLSCFKQLFARGQVFTYDLSELARYYINYVKLMDHWDKTLPDFVYRVNYEQLISNQEGETKNLLDFCQLDFEKETLQFYNTKRAVKTASSEQVRQPIYQRGLDHWKNYEDDLSELKRALEPLRERFNIPD
jgi:tetratricopeptide (TPR) repeat protein|tara:strand:- start:203 stop:2218 length:2016 start_codon:yes stop_codon:yes gene_type:complete